MFLNTRSNRGLSKLGGGVGLFVREDIPCKLLSDLANPDHEVIWAMCRPTYLPRLYSCIIVASVYYPESAKNRRDLVSYLQKTVDVLRIHYSNPAFIIAGDFNQTKKGWLSSSLSLKQVVHMPTHVSGSILDLILTNCESYYCNPVSLGPVAKSDHFAILWKAHSSLP